MPLPQRSIKPINVAQSSNGKTDPEMTANIILANLIRQLSSLTAHSTGIFDDLIDETGNLIKRAHKLEVRVDRLANKVTHLGSTVDVNSLQDVKRLKTFKPTHVFYRKLFSRSTMPASMLDTYNVKSPFERSVWYYIFVHLTLGM